MAPRRISGTIHCVTRNAAGTRRLGEKMATKLKPGDCLCLTGDLGAGKTTFIQGVGRGLGIRGAMQSPTFVLLREYPEKKFFHFDMYRIGNTDFEGAGFSRYFNGDGICAVEWAENTDKCLPAGRISIEFRHAGGDRRKITIRKI